ncbi:MULTISPECIES: hypothetical protein [Microcystis]|uniref:hypothetical protein n=1 Tax=Microcystis TaxID=1125 RepID=UPI000A9F7F55|nr:MULTISPECIES: hypothetical protein [Microcystis]MDB9407532.1 hypothetical protein [Microcystis aeruginosa CS-558/01A06]
MRSGFFYDFSNYGSYERLTDDGLTQWHPAGSSGFCVETRSIPIEYPQNSPKSFAQ